METGAAACQNRRARRGRCGASARLLLDQLYPPVCLACDAPVASADALCADCFRRLRPITAPLCPVLGLPFEVSLGPEALSAEAIADPPPFDRARSAVIYNEVARALVGRLKYGDRPEFARFCARLMAQAGHEFWGRTPCWCRCRCTAHGSSRGATTSRPNWRARSAGSPDCRSMPPRPPPRRTRQQVGLSGDARQRNVAGAFAVHPDALARLTGRRVVLVDDVITTGSTVKAITRALRGAGIAAVDVLSFARVMPGGEAL